MAHSRFETHHTAVVTGAARGIGLGIATRLARQGVEVALFDRDSDALATAQAGLRSDGLRAHAHTVDLTDGGQVQTAFAQVMHDLGKVDFLVNNAGAVRDTRFLKMSEDDWDLVVNTNLRSQFLLMNCAISLQLPSIASYTSDGALPVRMGSAAPYSAPNEAFETRDGWVMVAAYIGDRWDRLCHVLGRPELIEDERFASSRLRTANRPALRLELGVMFRSQSTAHWLDALLAEDILCAKVANYEDLMAHPQLHANGTMTHVDVPGHGSLRMPGFPINSLAENAMPHRPAPKLGQHTRDVLRACAVNDDEIDELIASGAAR